MGYRVSSLLVALALLMLVAGCDKSPVTQMDESKATLKSAQTGEAEAYAPELYKMASDSLAAAEVEIQKQDGRFALLRNYDRAKELLAAASRVAADAKDEAIAEKERVREADSVLIAEIDEIFTQANTLLAQAPKSKGSRVDRKVLQADIDAINGAFDAAKQTYNLGKYTEAEAQLETVKSKILGTKTQIETAIASVTKK